jgi:cytochrome c oxidase subunit II
VLRRQGRMGDRVAGRLSGMKFVGLGGIVFPLVILAVLFAWTLETLVEVAPGAEEPELTIEITGRQWFWDVRYPGAGDAVTANEIYIPVGVPVEFEVHTEDVLHSFWVPRLNRKIDLLPGEVNRVTLTADEEGTFRGQCAEYCGTQHGNMAFLVIAVPHDRFDSWLANLAAPAVEPVERARQDGQQVFLEAGCADCHTIRGTRADGDAGPDLTHLAARRTLAGVTVPNTRGDLGGWILDPQGIKPGAKMPGFDLDGDELNDLLDYLGGLR